MKFSCLVYRVLMMAGLLAMAGCDSSGGGTVPVTAPVTTGAGSTPGTGTGTGANPGTTTPSNTPPAAKSDVAVVGSNSENNPVDVMANDTDADGDPLQITSVSVAQSLPPASGGVATVAPDGRTLRYTPPTQFIGQQVLLYTVSDGRGGSSQAVALVTTSALPIPPVAVPDVFTVLGDGSVTSLAVLSNDIDGAGGGLVVSAAQSDVTVPAGNSGTVSVVSGALQYQPRAGFIGVETLSYTLRDANGATATAVALVTVLPLAAPPVALPDVVSTAVNTPVQILVLSNDVDLAGGGLTLVSAEPLLSVPAGSNGSFSVVDNSLRFVPASSSFVGVQTAQYTLRDVNGSTALGLVTITVTPALPQLPPVAVPDAAVITGNSSNAVLAVLDNDIDAAAGGLTITAASVVAAIPATAGSVVTTDGSVLQLTPPTGFAGVLTLSYTVRDANGQTASAPVIVTVTPLALPAVPPVALPDVAVVPQGSSAALVDVLANDVDLAGGGLTLSSVTLVSSLPAATHAASVSSNQLSFTPTSGFAGAVTLSYTVLDSQGQSATGLVNIVVTPALLALGPVALPDVATVAQDSTASSLNVLSNDLDPAGTGLTLGTVATVSSLPIAVHSVSISGNQLSFTPASGFAGAVVLSYTVADSQGQTASSLVNIVVTPLAIAPGPVALPDVAMLTQDSSANSINVSANDVDATGTGLTVTAVSVVTSLPVAVHAVAVVGNAVEFTPASAFSGLVTLSYTVRDTNGLTASGVVAITVTPALPIALPAAVGDVGALAVTLLTGGTGTFDVLANDIDPTGAGLTLQSVDFANPLLVTPGSVLGVVGNQVQLDVPLLGLIAGVLPIEYTAVDSLGRPATGLLSVTLSP